MRAWTAALLAVWTAVLTLVALGMAAFVLASSCGEETGPRLRMVLAPQEEAAADELDAALAEVSAILELRLEEVGARDIKVEREANHRIAAESVGEEGEGLGDVETLARTGLLQFCEPVTDENGNVAIVREGTPLYEPQTCQPMLDQEGNVQVEGGAVEFASWPPQMVAEPYTDDQIVWQPATALLRGEATQLTGRFLQPETYVVTNFLDQPVLIFEWTADGADVSEAVTGRLSERKYPLAPFLDGEPIRGEDGTIIAPRVQSAIGRDGGQITGLSLEDAEDLSAVLDGGAFPIPMRVVEVVEQED